jgi:hypothetical protein
MTQTELILDLRECIKTLNESLFILDRRVRVLEQDHIYSSPRNIIMNKRDDRFYRDNSGSN